MSIQESITTKAMKYSLDITKKLASVSLEFLIAVVNKLNTKIDDYDLKKNGGRTTIEALNRIIKKGNEENDKPMQIVIPDEDFPEFEKCLKQQNVLYCALDMGQDDCKQVVYPQSYQEKVLNSFQVFQANRSLVTEIQPVAFVNSYGNSDLNRINNLSVADVELFRHYAKEELAKNPDMKFPFTVITKKDNTFAVLYPKECRNLAQNALFKASWDLAGEQGARIKEQIQIKFSNKQEINIAIADAEREFYIVDANNKKNYIKVTAGDFEFYKNNKQISTVSKLSPDYTETVYTTLKGLEEPILISPEDFNKGPKTIDRILNQRTAVFPEEYSAAQAAHYQNLIAQIFGGNEHLMNEHGPTYNYKHQFDTLIPSTEKIKSTAPSLAKIEEENVPLHSLQARKAAVNEYVDVDKYYSQFRQSTVPLTSKDLQSSLNEHIMAAELRQKKEKEQFMQKEREEKDRDNR